MIKIQISFNSKKYARIIGSSATSSRIKVQSMAVKQNIKIQGPLFKQIIYLNFKKRERRTQRLHASTTQNFLLALFQLIAHVTSSYYKSPQTHLTWAPNSKFPHASTKPHVKFLHNRPNLPMLSHSLLSLINMAPLPFLNFSLAGQNSLGQDSPRLTCSGAFHTGSTRREAGSQAASWHGHVRTWARFKWVQA